ncbi:Nup120p SCDLUD_004166 [Saccharomycodes ludwigii]|uniref:Nup120p n=1 Tax=Saccharomycodes ludwigii TaxID=36035 RepID=UPI001E8BD112|nr:hypothetical protein SCDLUD_004166 [Saccharomycodes ludwigii]KAH3899867.1 hypothetical protein SCDLUD_004166 [Saccharomycodes ludwigii]
MVLAKIDIDLTLGTTTQKRHYRHFFLNSGSTKLQEDVDSTKITSYDYSNTITVNKDTDYVLNYMILNDYTAIGLSLLNTAIDTPALIIHLPDFIFDRSLHNISIRVADNGGKQYILIETILQSNRIIYANLPLNMQFSLQEESISNFCQIFYPYDFQIRQPISINCVSDDLTIVTLKDGGLLSLIKHYSVKGGPNFEYETILFNDNTYLHSLTEKFFFFKKNKHNNGNSIANSANSRTGKLENFLNDNCIVSMSYLHGCEKLLTLSASLELKVWDMKHNRNVLILQEKLISIDTKNNGDSMFVNLGTYLCCLESKDQNNLVYLLVYLPIRNGVFQLYQLSGVENDKVSMDLYKEIDSTMDNKSTWSLIDLRLKYLLDSNTNNNIENLEFYVLWKNNTSCKLELWNNNNEWIKSISNKTIVDTFSPLGFTSINYNNDIRTALLNLKAQYGTYLFNYASNEIYNDDDDDDDDDDNNNTNSNNNNNNNNNNDERIIQLESLLKQLKRVIFEPSSLAFYSNDIPIINNLSDFPYFSVYKWDSINVKDDQLTNYLGIVQNFIKILPFNEICQTISKDFIAMVQNDTPISSGFDDLVVRRDLKKYVNQGALDRFVNELSKIDDFISVLNNLIENYIHNTTQTRAGLISSILPNTLDTSLILESLNRSVIQLNELILKILFTFTVLEFDYNLLKSHIGKLLKMHYMTELWLTLYKLDKSELIMVLFHQYSQYGHGFVINNGMDSLINITEYLFSQLIDYSNFEPVFYKLYCKKLSSGNNTVTKTNEALDFNYFVGTPFSLNNSMAQQYLLGLLQYKCANYDQCYEIMTTKNKTLCEFKLPSIISRNLPAWSKSLIGSSGNASKFKDSIFFYELSLLFYKASNYTNSLKCIKKSIAISSLKEIEQEQGETKSNAPANFKKNQIKHYIDVLSIFDNFKEIMDVLILNSNDYTAIDDDSRYKYYEKLLLNHDLFYQTIIDLSLSDELILPLKDYNMIDNLLLLTKDRNCNLLLTNTGEITGTNTKFQDYLKVFNFRLSNENTRKAVEIMYEYYQMGDESNSEYRENARTLIVNILSSYKNEKDRWFLDSKGQIILLKDL